MRYTVVIADDHEIVRAGLKDALKEGERLYGFKSSLEATASNGLEALAAVKSHKPDILFLDISMPLANGVEILADIKRWSPETKTLIFTGIITPGLLSSVVESGVHAVFSKSESSDIILKKLPLIMAGGRFVAPSLVAAIEKGQQSVKLTEREKQTLNMIIAGKSNKEMAAVLNISPKTVDKHRTSLMSKLGVHSIAELMARALDEGLIENGAQ